ncbi:MAG: T9SS type A sorting domain-containing protein [Candidatus Delongbacteria bacterium]
MFRFPAILFGVLTALPVAAELVPLGDWPVDATRAALQVDDELIRNYGRVLERWDLTSDPPLPVDGQVLDSPPVDLLEWDGLLLVLREDGVLEARDLAEDWRSPIWDLDAGNCATQLLRHGNLLLPMGQGEVRLVDMTEPRSPVLLPHVLGEGLPPASIWGGNFAASVDGHLVGELNPSCEQAGELSPGGFHMQLDSLGQSTDIYPIDDIGWDWLSGGAAGVAGGVLIGGGGGTLDWVGPPSWQRVASLPFRVRASTLAAAGQLGWVSQVDSLFQVRVDPQADPMLEVTQRLGVPGGQDAQVLPGQLLVTGRSRSTWLDTTGDLVPVRSLAAPGPILALAWAGERLMVRQDKLYMLRSTEEGLEQVGSLELGAGSFLDAGSELILAQVPQGTAVIRWPVGEEGQVVATLPTSSHLGLTLCEPWALTYDNDTLALWDLSTPTEPRFVDHLVIPGLTFLDARGNGNVAAANLASGGIQLFRLSADQLELGALLPDDSWSFDFVGHRLVVAVFRNAILQLKTYDATDPTQPVLLLNQTLPEDVWIAVVRGGTERLALFMLESWDMETPGTTFLHTYRFDPQQGWLRTGQQLGWGAGLLALSDDEVAGRLAVSLPGAGARVWLDDSVLPVEPAPVRPRALTLAAAPNPFNPVTRLSFTLERPGAVRLAVFDLLGREVALPAAGDFAAGHHEITFDGSALASGIYFARLEAEGRTALTKLALVK